MGRGRPAELPRGSSTSGDRQLGAGVSIWSTWQPTQRNRPQAVTQTSDAAHLGGA